MRRGLLVAALLVSGGLHPRLAIAADPPVVFQVQPPGRALNDARATLRTLGGDRAVNGFNGFLRDRLGERGFDGLDLGRPLVGYVTIPANPEEAVAVVAIPVAGEADFVDLCARLNRSKPTRNKAGLIELPSLAPGLIAKARVHNGYAYVATAAKDPTPALEPAALVPAHTLFDPAEQSIATAKLYFDRLDPALRDKLVAYLDQAAKFEPMGGVGGIGGIELQVLAKAVEQLTKLGKRYVGLSRDAQVATLRVGLDPRAADLTAELTLTPVPGSELAKQIAARKPTTNKFAGLLTPDTAAGFATRLPFFAPELQDATVAVLERVQTAVAQGTTPAEKEPLDELFKGLVRTVKAGEFDLAASFRGPDKTGAFTLVGAIAFEDPAALEKAVRKYVDSLPADDKVRRELKWDVAKAGGVGVHLIDGRTFGGFTPDTKTFGDAPRLAFAFAPHAVLFAVGTDPVPAVAGAVAVRPGPAPVLDVVVNPARLGKLAGLTGGLGSQAEIARAFGTDDRRVSIVSLTVEGGAELKVRFALSLKLVPADVYGGPEEPKKK